MMMFIDVAVIGKSIEFLLISEQDSGISIKLCVHFKGVV